MAAARDRDREAGQARLQLAQHRGRRAAASGRVGARHEDHQLALGEQAGAVVRPARAVARPARLGERRQRAALDRARAALGDVRTRARQSPSSGPCGRARTTIDAGAAAEVAAQLGGAGHDVLAVGDAAREQVLEEVADGGLARALGRA